MDKKEKLAAFEGIDTDILTGSKKNKQIVKMFLQGMTYKEIAGQYELTKSRIGQILDRQARRANYYKMKNKLLLDYIISLTHLYGLVHKDKVVEIYNMQNEDKVNEEIINDILKEEPQELSDNFVEIYGDYFVVETILMFDEFEYQLKQREGKPFYIPEKEELLKYKDDTYFEITKEYEALKSYVTRNIYDGDETKAEMLCEDIKGLCQFGFSIETISSLFNERNVDFKSEEQVSEVMQLIMELANNTRIWENNGHTPNEIFNQMERPNLRPLPNDGAPNLKGIPGGQAVADKKIGRNDPCPCGSGKKYKKCCGGN